MIALESKEEAGRLEGVVAGDLEAIKEAARFDAERVGDADVAATTLAVGAGGQKSMNGYTMLQGQGDRHN